MRRDLFSDRGEGFVTDRKHVDELALAKLEDEAERIRAEGWKWVEARIEFTYTDRHKFGQVYAEHGKEALSAAAKKELQDIESELQKLNGLDDVDSLTSEQEDMVDRLRARERYIRGAAEAWTAKQKSACGAIVHLEDGNVFVVRGLVRPGEAPPAGSRVTASRGSKPPKRPTDLSRPIVDRLLAQRTAMLQAEALGNTDVALAILAQRLLLGALYREYSDERTASRITFKGPEPLEAKASELPMMRHYAAMQDCIEKIRQGLPLATKLLDWLLNQPRDQVVNLIAAATALSIDTSHMGESIGSASPLMPLITKLGCDFADHWEPTPETFLEHVPRAVIEQAVKEACGAPALKQLENLNKAQTVEAAAQLLAGKRWLPKPLRRAKPQGSPDDSADKATAAPKSPSSRAARKPATP
ncbi:MAG: hypothetical protein ACTHK2_15650 [Dokdonella sp.]|uniref:hypothetical protein n=1 Tax=Dokdonella sp. TaxID=2291710 RepID=UPI003F81914C